jgi:FSR family fosmidomycin resistance protein-like MFS transporter
MGRIVDNSWQPLRCDPPDAVHELLVGRSRARTPIAGLTLVLLAVAWRFPFSDGRKAAVQTSFAEGMRGALRTLRRHDVLRWLTWLQFSDLMLDILLGFLALYMVDVGKVTPAQAGMAVAIWTGLGLLGDLLLIPLLERVRGLDYLRWSALLEFVLYVAFC